MSNIRKIESAVLELSDDNLFRAVAFADDGSFVVDIAESDDLDELQYHALAEWGVLLEDPNNYAVRN